MENKMEKEWKRREGKEKEKKELTLVGLVFSWSLEDILNEKLFHGKVHKIPKTFNSVNQYLKAYINPLIEETRAELCSCMLGFSRLPFTEIHYVETTLSPKLFLCIVKVDIQDKKNYIPQKGDLFALSNVRPSHLSDLTRFGKSYNIGLVTKGGEFDEDLPPGHYIVEVSKAIETGEYGEKQKEPRLLFAVSLMNITTNSRIWSALNVDVSNTLRNLSIVKQVLCTNFKMVL
ncbi:hypothetical protein QJS04_geneDACA019592 [Acorus gramineus]|uniref:DUF6469 domain-containing protein n=1 Tax=Acorus gramineus TaxID=55184 RepID=A0AAV9ACI3_ACOGR|nr:hypothetical protein QJS04_geneDACA019592 [Acorus gramineus]